MHMQIETARPNKSFTQFETHGDLTGTASANMVFMLTNMCGGLAYKAVQEGTGSSLKQGVWPSPVTVSSSSFSKMRVY
jgi:hypothetical protein